MNIMAENLTDSLLDDLDDLSDVEQEDQEEQEHEDEDDRSPSVVEHDTLISSNHDSHDDMAKGIYNHSNLNKMVVSSSSLIQRKRLLNDSNLLKHMEAIHHVMHSGDYHPNHDDDDDDDHNDKEIVEDERYQLLTTTNRFLIQIQNEINKTHVDLVHIYKIKFPELDDLLPNAVLYKNAIKVIQNETDVTNLIDRLSTEAKLTSNQIITLSVASSTTFGQQLSKDQLKQVNDIIHYMEQVLSVKDQLISFVEMHMERLAPNTCAMIGAQLAAKMVGLAGGMAELAKIPSCNLQVLGQTKATSSSRAGMSTNVMTSAAAAAAAGSSSGQVISKPHEGIINESDLYNRVPPQLQKKALKVIAAKLALAIRCDYVNLEAGRARTNESGRKFRAEIEQKFVKWEEPDRAPVVKALPKPDLTTKKRRGGKRMRQLKEKFTESEMMKQANRRGFGVETGEYADDAMGQTLGFLEKSRDGSGNIRHMAGSAANKRKMKQANTKASRKRAAQMAGGQTNGLATSVVFTPVQGLELVNPEAAADRVKEANKKWFAETSGFQSALPSKPR